LQDLTNHTTKKKILGSSSLLFRPTQLFQASVAVTQKTPVEAGLFQRNIAYFKNIRCKKKHSGFIWIVDASIKHYLSSTTD
jgi:hypothetical protein